MSVIVKITMPEDGHTESEFADLLNEVDDPEFDKKLSRNKSNRLKSILNLLQNGKVPTKDEAEKLVKLCAEDDRNCLGYEVAITSELLKTVQLAKILDTDLLVSSAIFLLELLKSVFLTTMRLRSLTIQTILLYPDTVLTKVFSSHSNLLFDVFNTNYGTCLSEENKMEVCHLLKVLKILPLAEAQMLVKKGISTWLNVVIPRTMGHMAIPTSENSTSKEAYVNYLEVLTDLLITTNYLESSHWDCLLECICNTKKYPSIIKKMLEDNSDIWHRLWIILIKLLNSHITKNIGGLGTPINSMLPVVELAFKMHAEQRIRAFECWNKLIDNFSKETNENCITKRIKLLTIPLKLNNAKTEDIALAKFDTWWHLIRSFDHKSERFCHDVLIPFLQFVFGKPGTPKQVIPAAQLSHRLKRKSLEAFVEIVGHTDCECSIDIPKSKNKLLNMKLMVNNWNDWMYCLSNAFKNAGDPAVYELSTKNYLKCTWKTVVQLIAELPDNAVRRDIFIEMLGCILNMLKDPQSTDQLRDVIVTAVMSSLFNGNAKIQDLLKTKTDKYKPLFMITSAFINASMSNYYQRFTDDQLRNMFKPITKLILEEAVKQENYFFDCLLPNDISLKFWTETVDNLSELSVEISPELLSDLMEWPLKSLEAFKEVKVAGMKWYSVYNDNHKKLNQTGFNKDVLRYIAPNVELVNYFTICVTIGVLKQRILKEESPDALAKLLENFTCCIKNYEEFKEIVPLIVDTIVVMLNNVAEKTDKELAKTTIKCAKNLFGIVTTAIEKNENDNTTTHNLLILLTNLQNAINPLLKVEAYTDSIVELINELSSNLSKIKKDSPLFNHIVIHLNKLLSLTNDMTIREKINKAIEPNQKSHPSNQNNNVDEPVKEFTTPEVKKVRKKRKTEVDIVNKVVENGEEYVVVKSHWKFNPKKLTENQKEKLQRKREDIPALYQDLSQSQDEAKLLPWKTDSQDPSTTSTSNSNTVQSAANNEVKTILKNLPNTDVVPKIMENFLQDSDKNIQLNNIDTIKEKSNRNGTLTPTTKNTKSPRMALKDRVFRNMKNLLEKSTPLKDQSEIVPQQTENILKTPPSRPKNEINVANSAPPILTADRPSRVKRKPKKFDDAELLFTLKKRRHSRSELVQSDSQNDSQNELPPIQINKPETVEIDNDVIMEVSEQKILENSSDKLVQQKEVKDNTVTESLVSIDIEEKNGKEDTPNDISEITKTETGNDVVDSSNVNNIEPSVKISLKESCNETVLETIVISESEVFIEPKVVQESVLPTNDKVIEANRESIITVEPKIAEVTVETLLTTPTHKIKVTGEPKLSVKNTVEELLGTPIHNIKVTSEPKLSTKKNNVEELLTTPRHQIRVTAESNSLAQKSTVEELLKTPTHKIRVTSEPKSSSQKSTKKSRIEKELAIDMVEGHPFLKLQTEKRLTRKKLMETELSGRRKSVAEKFNKSKSEATPKSTKKTREKKTSPTQTDVTVYETQEGSQPLENVLLDEPVCSEDVIESSQDSTITTISVKSTKNTTKRQPVITLERMNLDIVNVTQNLLQDSDVVIEPNKTSVEDKDDTLLPRNKIVEPDKSQSQLTENMDTEPIDEKDLSDDVIIIMPDYAKETPITINSETVIGPETQEIAEADTQPNNSVDFMEFENSNVPDKETLIPIDVDVNKTQDVNKDESVPEITITENRPLQADSVTEAEKANELSSPFKDDDQRKKDFLNNTSEISPIKIQSPDRDKKSPSPETSSDYVVIKLSSPVHSNGEPFEKHGSPEFFTDDKISPEKRDISPPRTEISIVNNTSPSSSLSLKKNKPQVRSGGRAAHMLGLCVPEKLNTMKMVDRAEPEEAKKASTPARRNLRILYNTVPDNNESTDNEESENFLRLKRSLPSVDSSPAGPILKRKLAEMSDEPTTSPASKRKRVSFHDPPVSTTVSVHKYIEPIGLRSPQNSAQKRLERQTRQSQYSKSPKRLDNVFKLETVLSKTVESFTDDQPSLPEVTPEDTQPSLEVTPAIEIVKNSDLNDTDPICPELVDCNDPILVIAAELSSPSLKHLFVKQIDDKIKTVGDLAKMTEVEVCRLCIKAPKVKVAKKVLSDYSAKINKPIDTPIVELTTTKSPVIEPVNQEPVREEVEVTNISSVEIQTDEVSQCDMEVQTIIEPMATGSTQTDSPTVAHTDVQTDESSSKTTGEIITSCVDEREDFIDKLSELLEESSIRKIAESLPTNTVFDILMEKQTSENVLRNILTRESLEVSGNSKRRIVKKSLSFLANYMSQTYKSNDLILFCSQLLQMVHDRPS